MPRKMPKPKHHGRNNQKWKKNNGTIDSPAAIPHPASDEPPNGDDSPNAEEADDEETEENNGDSDDAEANEDGTTTMHPRSTNPTHRNPKNVTHMTRSKTTRTHSSTYLNNMTTKVTTMPPEKASFHSADLPPQPAMAVGVVVALILGGVFVVAFIAGVVVCCFRRKKTQNTGQSEDVYAEIDETSLSPGTHVITSTVTESNTGTDNINNRLHSDVAMPGTHAITSTVTESNTRTDNTYNRLHSDVAMPEYVGSHVYSTTRDAADKKTQSYDHIDPMGFSATQPRTPLYDQSRNDNTSGSSGITPECHEYFVLEETSADTEHDSPQMGTASREDPDHVYFVLEPEIV